MSADKIEYPRVIVRGNFVLVETLVFNEVKNVTISRGAVYSMIKMFGSQDTSHRFASDMYRDLFILLIKVVGGEPIKLFFHYCLDRDAVYDKLTESCG